MEFKFLLWNMWRSIVRNIVICSEKEQLRIRFNKNFHLKRVNCTVLYCIVLYCYCSSCQLYSSSHSSSQLPDDIVCNFMRHQRNFMSRKVSRAAMPNLRPDVPIFNRNRKTNLTIEDKDNRNFCLFFVQQIINCRFYLRM